MKLGAGIAGIGAIALIVWLWAGGGSAHTANRHAPREAGEPGEPGRDPARAPESAGGTGQPATRSVAVFGVVTAGDEPVWGFNLAAYPEGKDAYVAEDTTRVDGRYRLVLPEPGRYEIVVHAEVASLTRVTRRTVQVDDDTRLDIELEAGAVLAGVARDGSGKPVENVWIYALDEPVEERETPHETTVALQDAARGYAQTDAQGRFAIRGVSPRDRYVLQVADVHWIKRRPAGPVHGEHVEVELQQGRRIRVHVLDAATGLAVKRLRIRSGGPWIDADPGAVTWVPGPARHVEITAAGFATTDVHVWRHRRGIYHVRALLGKDGPPNVILHVERHDGSRYPGPVSLEARENARIRSGFVVGTRDRRLRLPPGKWAAFVTLDRLAGNSVQIIVPLKVEYTVHNVRIVLPPTGTLRLRRPPGGAQYRDLVGPGWTFKVENDAVELVATAPRPARWFDRGGDVVELDVVAGTWRFDLEGAGSVEVPAGGTAELTMPARRR